MAFKPGRPVTAENPMPVVIVDQNGTYDPGLPISATNPVPMNPNAVDYKPGRPISSDNPLPVTLSSGPGPGAPTNITAPTIEGTPEYGETIAATMTFGNGTWSGSITEYVPGLRLNGVSIDSSHIWDVPDDGKELIYDVTANGPGGSTSASSDPFDVVIDVPAPVNTALPTVTGTPVEGQSIAATMTFSDGTWTGLVDSYTRQIFIGLSPVSSAYIWQSGDEGQDLTVEVTANGPSHSASATSEPLTIQFAGVPVYIDSAAIEDDLVDGATITINYGNWNAETDTLLITLKADDATIGTPWSIAYGDAEPTFTYSAATMDGRLLLAEIIGTNTGSGQTATTKTPARVGMGTSDPVSFTANFTGPVDTPVADENGWLIAGDAGGISYAKAAYVKSPEGYLRAKYAPGGRYLARVASANSGFEVVWPFVSTATTVYRDYFVLMTDYQNYVQIFMRYDRVLIDQRVAGVQTTVPGVTNVLGPWGADAVLRTQIKNSGGDKYIQVFVNGVEITSGVNGGLGFGPINAALTSGTMVGIGPGGGESGDHWILCKSFKVITPPADNIDVSISGIMQSPADPAKQRITISGSYTGSVSALEWAMVVDGAVVIDWTDITSESAGSYSDTVDIDYADGGTPVIYVRDKVIHGAVAWKQFTSIIAPTLGLARMGMNEGFVAGWASAAPYEDWGCLIEWRDVNWNYITARGCYAGESYQLRTSADGSGGTVKMDLDGTIYATNSLGLTVYRLVIPAYFPSAGTYVLKLATGLSITRATGSATWSYTGDELTFDVPSTDGFILSFDITTASMPSTGLLPKGKKQGDAYTSRPTLNALTASSIDAIASGVRVMTGADVNNAFNSDATRTDTQLPIETPEISSLAGPGINRQGAEYAAAYAADSNIDFLWYVTKPIASTELLAQDMQRLADLLVSTSRTAIAIFSERGNELWNSGAAWNRSFHDARLDGLRLGYAPLAVTSHDDPDRVTETIIDGTVYINNLGVVLAGSRTFTAGEKIYVNWSAQGGYIVVMATATISAGNSLAIGTNCNILYDGTAVFRATLRGIARRAKEKWAAEDAVLVAMGLPRTVHVFAWQAGDTFANAQIALDFDDFYKDVDRIAIAPYWGDRLGEWSNATWTSTSKAKIYSGDTAGFIADFVTAATADITVKINNVKAWMASLLVYSKTKRGDKNAITLCYYESQWHLMPSAWPDMCGVYAAGTSYAAGAFVLASDGQTYVSKSGSNVGHEPSASPTYWDLYWDASETFDHRGDGSTLRTFQEGFVLLKQSQEFAALNKSYYEQSAAAGVREQCYFDRIGVPIAVVTNPNAAISDISSWAAMAKEADTKIDGTAGTNWMFKALTELHTEFPG